jgi:Uncharacterised nucleotidyltransferase
MTPSAGIPEVLRGSWRAKPPKAAFDGAVLERWRERIIVGGAGGLAWSRIRDAELASTSVGEELHDVFRLQVLDVLGHERRLAIALELLSDAGVDPVLGKGWAVARLYPQAALRPYGDLDLFVDPEQIQAGTDALAAYSVASLQVDLHAGMRGGDLDWERVRDKSLTVGFQDGEIKVLSHEHHLALLCPHMFDHGAWRPAWLCDIAMMVERDDEIDWDIVSEGSKHRAATVRAAVLLARDLLGADISRTPWSDGEALPHWVESAVRNAWSREHYSTTSRFVLTPRTPSAIAKAMRTAWPNPIETTMRWKLPFNGAPRWPFQLLDIGARTARALYEAPGHLRDQRRAELPPEE